MYVSNSGCLALLLLYLFTRGGQDGEKYHIPEDVVLMYICQRVLKLNLS